jgi:Cys-rich four helix bundle protein (predicted Tat secretion target)
MDRREFIAAAGTVAAVASTSQAFAQMAGGGEMEAPMHPPKYEALEKACGHCVLTANDCLRHCFGMFSMKDTSMVGCVEPAYAVATSCAALEALAAVNSDHTGHLAKTVAMICRDCQKECEKFPKVAECKACGDSCKACAAECDKAAAA